jgi:hypothetical protein
MVLKLCVDAVVCVFLLVDCLTAYDLNFSRRTNLLGRSAIELKTKVSEIFSVSIIRVVVGIEEFSIVT